VLYRTQKTVLFGGDIVLYGGMITQVDAICPTCRRMTARKSAGLSDYGGNIRAKFDIIGGASDGLFWVEFFFVIVVMVD
jgi:hypothetical protein